MMDKIKAFFRKIKEFFIKTFGEKQPSLRAYVNRGYYISGILSVVMSIGIVLFIVGTVAMTGAGALAMQIIGVVIFFLALSSFIMLYIYYSEKTYFLYHELLYKNSLKNLEAIKGHTTEQETINDDTMEEFKEINVMFSDIQSQMKGKIVATKEGDYSNITLEYLDEEHIQVTFESLVNNIVNLIISTKSFRNALVDLSYDLGRETIQENDLVRIVNEVKNGLDYKNILIAKNKKGNGIVVYIPVFDSVSQLEEEVTSLIRRISLIRRTAEGRKVVAAKVAMVIYPYSAPENMFNDLAVAKRSDKPINVYLPNKENKSNTAILYESMNVNQLAKISERLNLLDMSSANEQKEVNRALNDVCNYFNFTCVGYANFNRIKNQYFCEYTYSPVKRDLVPLEKPISYKFISKLVELKDNDQSYYFSTRKHLNNALGLFIDSHEIKSGLFYLVLREGQPISIIYLLNDDKDMEYDNSIKQGLINITNKIGNHIKSMAEQYESNINARRFQEILKINNDILYSVDPEDYQLLFMSPALKSLARKAKLGEKCYKTLYGLDSPCEQCPLKTKKHMVEILKKRKFETSVILHNADDKAEHLYLTPMERNKSTSDLFSPEFLINSYYSFCSVLEDEFSLAQEGEVLFLKIDNVPQIIKTLGNEGYIKTMRYFFDILRDQVDANLNLYLYKNDNFALFLPISERETTIKLVESIYSLSKNIKVGAKNIDLSISYFDFKYPDGKASMKVWLNYAERVMTGVKRGKNTDCVYFNEDKYLRSASREAFMLENVLEAFNKKKYHMDYQPIVGNKDRTIHGVELLLRLNDPFSNEPMNIGEAINVLTNYNRIDLVASAVKDCLDKLFKNTDIPFFKSVGLEHISINIDYTTLADQSFIDSFESLTNKHRIPKGFICFEIPEKDFAEHYNDYRNMKFENVTLVCDQYRGELLRLDELQTLGVKQLKISRDVILNIAYDDVALNRAVDVWKSSNEMNMQVVFVGVEKRQQADLLHDDVLDSGFQGRFFFSPLSEEKFFKTLRENSIKEIADLDN